jgi:prevent-host-death family protein
MAIKISIGQVKRDISELVNRVAYGGERILLTSRGNPKAAIVSLQDFDQLQEMTQSEQNLMWVWMDKTKLLVDDILQRRQGEVIDVKAIRNANRADLEAKDAWIIDRN